MNDVEEIRRQVKGCLDAIEDIKSMHVSVSVEHIRYLADEVPVPIIERVLHFVNNPVACKLMSVRGE